MSDRENGECFLDQYIKERSERNPDFEKMVEEALEKRKEKDDKRKE